MILVMRYKGRRVLALNPAETDMRFVASWVDPVEVPDPVQTVSGALECKVDHLLTGAVP